MEIASASQDGLWDQELAQIEKGLNIAGYIPVVSYYSGLVRGFMGVTQIVIGVAEEFFLRKKVVEVEERPVFSNPLVCHGIANCIRAFVGANGSFIGRLLGNAGTLLYDFSGIRYSYYKEEKSSIWR